MAAIAAGSVAGAGLLAPTANAATTTPTITFAVSPPNGVDGAGSPNPLQGGVTGGVPTGTEVLVSVGLAAQGALFTAPTGTISLTDSQGLITTCQADSTYGVSAGPSNAIPLTPNNPLYSVAYCGVTFPAGTTGSEVLTATYTGDANNGGVIGTQTINFASPPAETPESPLALALPLTALAMGGGGFLVLRRRSQAA